MKVLTLAVGPVQANCYLVGDPASGSAAIIDPGDEAERILRELPAQWKVSWILVTHAHFDHVGAVGALKARTGAPFLMHPADLELLRQAPETSRLFLGQPMAPPPEPDAPLAHGQRLELGALTMEVRHTPGHSPGSVSLVVWGEPPAVFSGDALFAGSIGRTDLPQANHSELLASIRRELLVLEDRTLVYPGHGPTTTIGHERRTNPFLQGL